MLVIRIDIEKNKENYQAVMAALADFDVDSTAWEDVNSQVKVEAKSARTGDDLSSAISAAINAVGRSRGGR